MNLKLIPFLWFETQASQAAAYYINTFPESSFHHIIDIPQSPGGKVELFCMTLWGTEFQLMNSNSPFSITPAISFHVLCSSREEVERIWNRLIFEGTALMELGEYPFSQCFGWLIDQFGVSWQIDYFEGKAISQRVIPTLLFSGEQCGKGKDAISLYTSTFPDSKLQKVLSYGEDEEPNHANTIKRAEFTLNGQSFALLEREHPQPFTFNEAISFLVLCETQEEIDQIWEKLSAFPEAEACGWLKDPFGVSWQLVPALLYELEQGNETNRVARVHQALLQMKKLNISQLQSAYFS